MVIGEQLVNPTETRLRLSTQFGVEHVVIDNRGSDLVSGDAGNPVVAWVVTKRDQKHSYWGVGYPTNQEEGGSGSSALCGQKLAREVPPVSEAGGWRALEFLAEGLLKAADRAGVRLAYHPHDPAYPVGGLNGVEHVLGSVDGMRRYMALSSSPHHGLNFCQGTVAEMASQPHACVMAAIDEFASAGKIFMVHFRNIKGGYLDFAEVFPDEGDVDMHEAVRAYQRAGYRGVFVPRPCTPVRTRPPA